MKRLLLASFAALTLLSTPSAPHLVAVLGVGTAPLLTGCEDACDKQKRECEDQGLTVVDCKEEQTAFSDKCTCTCVGGALAK